MAAPITPHAIPKRAWFKHISGDFSPPVLGKRFSTGTFTSCSDNPEVTDARNDHLPCTSSALKPGRSVSTMKPRILLFSSSTLAQMMATLAIEPEVIHIFSPLNTSPAEVFLALVSMPPGFEPNCGSVNPKQPILSPWRMAGSHLSFCASLPNSEMGYIASDECTLTKLRMPLSPRSSSCVISPYSTLDMPGQPCVLMVAP